VETQAKTEALQASVEKMSLRVMSQEGQQIGGCYHDALVPAEYAYFRDGLGALRHKARSSNTQHAVCSIWYEARSSKFFIPEPGPRAANEAGAVDVPGGALGPRRCAMQLR
jgi:hypothetical protein